MNPTLRRLLPCVLLTPVLAYVQLVALRLIFLLVFGKMRFDDILNPEGTPTEVLAILAVLSLAQSASLLLPLPAQPCKGPSTPLLGRALLAAFLITVAFAIPILALLDMPTWLAAEGSKAEAIDLETIHALIATWALSWVFFAALLTHRGGREPDALERAVTRATAGTAVGLALATPWYLALRRRQQCYCALGTFYALVVGIWSLVLLGGPLLLLLRRDRRRRAAAEGAPSV